MSTEQNTHPAVNAWVEFAGEFFTVVGMTRYKLELTTTLREWKLFQLQGCAWVDIIGDWVEIADDVADPVALAKQHAFARVPENLHPLIVEALEDGGHLELPWYTPGSDLDDFALMWAVRDTVGECKLTGAAYRSIAGIIDGTGEEWAVTVWERCDD